MFQSDKPKILVVNDDPASLLALTSLLEQWAEETHYEVLAARSGQDALRQVLRHDFAVILLDVNMPGMDGFETAEAIHQRPRSADIPIIFVTAFLADEIDRLKAYQRGAADFLFTPVIPQILRAKVQVFVTLAMKNEQLKRQTEKLSQRTTELTATNKRLVREMEERRAAERTSSAKDEFLAMLGHELRNPLSAISSASALLGMPGVGAESVARARQIIGRRQTQHLSRIVDDLLDLSRAMSGKILLSRKRIDLARLVEACLDTFRATGRTNGYQISVAFGPGWVDGDATRLEQIATNLIDNALKYTPSGGSIQITVAREDDETVLRVRDSGVGIAEDLLPHVFDVFVQGAISIDRSQGGLGIGLSLVRRLVELHGGSVSATSPGSGAGSVFEIRLPHVEEAQAPESQASVDAGPAKPSVLLIEDNDDGREMMATMLASYGYPVLQARDGLEGVRVALAERPGVALVDIGLPGIDGYEVARRLRGDPATRALRLIALTGYGLAEDQRRTLEAGFDLHMVKPVDLPALLGQLSEPAEAVRQPEAPAL